MTGTPSSMASAFSEREIDETSSCRLPKRPTPLISER